MARPTSPDRTTLASERATVSADRLPGRTGLARAPLARSLPLRAVVPGRRHVPAHVSASQPRAA